MKKYQCTEIIMLNQSLGSGRIEKQVLEIQTHLQFVVTYVQWSHIQQAIVLLSSIQFQDAYCCMNAFYNVYNQSFSH